MKVVGLCLHNTFEIESLCLVQRDDDTQKTGGFFFLYSYACHANILDWMKNGERKQKPFSILIIYLRGENRMNGGSVVLTHFGWYASALANTQ